MNIAFYNHKAFAKQDAISNNKQSLWMVVVHIVVWSIFLSIPTIFNSQRFGQGPSKYIFDLLEPPRIANAIFFILVFYFNVKIVIPHFYFKHKYILLGFCIVLSAAFFSFINYAVAPAEVRILPTFTPLGNSFNLLMFIIVYSFSFIQCFYQQYHRIKEDKLSARISFLTAQINPHFLFNTLNSIHSLSLTMSPDTSEAIVKLSGIMRYSIGEGNQDKVLLSQEINYIQDYIELQKLRLTDEVTVNCKIHVENPELYIAPFLLIPFVENAFKHGVNGRDNSQINIDINVTQKSVNFSVGNTIVPTRSRPPGTGLGLDTTRQRLDLLYPAKHNLNVNVSDNDFLVILYIDLA